MAQKADWAQPQPGWEMVRLRGPGRRVEGVGRGQGHRRSARSRIPTSYVVLIQPRQCSPGGGRDRRGGKDLGSCHGPRVMRRATSRTAMITMAMLQPRWQAAGRTTALVAKCVYSMRKAAARYRRLSTAYRTTCLEFSPDGKRLATGLLDGTVKVWDVTTRPGNPDAEGAHGPGFRSCVQPRRPPPDQRLADMTVRIWDATPLPE